MSAPADDSQSRDPVDRLAEEFLARQRRGEWPQISEYIERHPDLADEIRAVFPPLILMERAAQAGPSSAAESGRVGPYRTIRLLGAGGQGEVYLAEDERLGRRVALKVLPPGTDPEGALMARFRREAAVTAKLDHPGICTVYEAGEERGTPFIAMRYVEGESLAQWITKARSDAKDAAHSSATREGVVRLVAIAEKAARALHVAHEAGLIHRDIKPGNLMLTAEGEPVLLDFGLARDVMAEGAALTQTGMRMGTPVYMSPEQIAAEQQRVDRRTDIYSLGVTLYECLTLRQPFEAVTFDQLYHQILSAEPMEARRLNPVVPRDLQIVLATAMEKERNRRYQTALAFAEDLRRVRELETIHARPAGIALRLRRWAQRNPVLATSVAALFLALVGGLLVSSRLLAQTRKERDAKGVALRRAGGLGLAAHALAVRERDPSLSLALAVEAASRAPGPQANEALLQALANIRERRRWSLIPGFRARSLLFLRGGETLLSGGDSIFEEWRCDTGESATARPAGGRVAANLIPSPDGTRILALRDAKHPSAILDADARETLVTLEQPESLREVGLFDAEFSDDGAFVFACAQGVAGADRRICIWDARSGLVVALLDGVDRGTFRSDGKALLAASAHRAILWELGRAARTVFESNREKGELLLAPFWEGKEPRLALTEGEARAVRVVDPVADTLVRELTGFGDAVRVIIAAPDGRRLLALTQSSVATFWDNTRGEKLGSSDLEEAFGRNISTAIAGGWVPRLRWSYRFRVCFARDGRTALLYTRHYNRGVIVDFEAGKVSARLIGHDGGIQNAAFHPGGKLVATVSIDGTARLWEAGSPSSVLALETPSEGGTHVLAYRGDGARLLTITDDGVLRVWDAVTGAVLWSIGKEANTFWGTFVEATGIVLTLASDGEVSLHAWDGESGREQPLPEALRVRAVEIEPSPDATRIAFVTTDGVRILDGRSGAILTSIRPDHYGESGCDLAWSPDGRRLATIVGAGPVDVWDASEGSKIASLSHPGGADQFRFRPGHDALVSAGGDARDLRLWGLPGGEQRCALRGHRDWIVGMILSGDGRFAATASGDGTARVWDLEGRRALYAVAPGMGTINGVRIDPTGRRLMTVAQDGEAQLWDLARGDLLYRLPMPEGKRAMPATYESGESLVAFSPDGERVAAATWTDTVRIWPVDPLSCATAWGPRAFTPEEVTEYLDPIAEDSAARREAKRLVDLLCAKLLLREEVAAHLRSEPGLSEEIRALALDQLRGTKEDPYQIETALWEIVLLPGREAAEYRRALRFAEALRRLGEPTGAAFAAVRFRLGEGDRALAELVALEESEGPSRRLLALRTLVRATLGDLEGARLDLRRWSELEDDGDAEAEALVEQALALITRR